MSIGQSALGLGAYTVPEAAHLLKIPTVNIRRWISGYNYYHHGKSKQMPPLWVSQIPAYGNHIELGFRDLIELKFVHEFLKSGIPLQVIRSCLTDAKKIINDDRPFSTRQFKTDGKTIFIEGIRESGEVQRFHGHKRR